MTKDVVRITQPDEIPADIWKSAVAATSVLPQAYGWRKITESVARAVLAERLECERKYCEAITLAMHAVAREKLRDRPKKFPAVEGGEASALP